MKNITLLLLILTTMSFAQKKKKRWSDNYVVKEKPTIPVEEINAFVASDEYLVTYDTGDFNGDKQTDAIVVVAQLDEISQYKKDETRSKRKVLILQRNDDGKLEKTLENEDIVYCYKCDSPYGSPLTSVVFSGNTFAIEHEAGKANRWTRIITFEFDREQELWLLLKDASSVYNIMNSKGFQSEVKTKDDFGFIYFENYDAFSEDLTKKSKH
ncbi:MAG: hypothetical protein ACPGU9_06265 [Flavobacteriaceae bacterium]